ncbi:tryptophan synthase alpha subunit [Cytobacillus horneckiae]|uniref:hypothetical protein n=1 Tax=Cytobacillus horneckiae TaxID=549687 RepID=UPI0019D29DF0|nr:hypothetical protein [Cytobacillus horneckiae]MBN6889302.1 hypothetical protein [Cytobacillus horneckiae]
MIKIDHHFLEVLVEFFYAISVNPIKGVSNGGSDVILYMWIKQYSSIRMMVGTAVTLDEFS